MAISRAQKKLCGGGKMAIDPAGPVSATTSRWLALSGTSVVSAPPNRYSAGAAMSRHATRAPPWSAREVRVHLYATQDRVVASTVLLDQVVPLNIVNCRLPENTPSVTLETTRSRGLRRSSRSTT
jgi:hypothetical protein